MVKRLVPFLLLIVILAACSPTEPTPMITEPAVTELAATVSPAPTPTFEPYHLKIASYPYMTEAPYFLAVEEGYFAEQGLEVEFVRFERATDALPALIAGDLDVSTVTPAPALLNAIAGGGTIKVVVGKGYFDPTACVYSGFMVTPGLLESGRLDDPANWAGLRISTERGISTEYALDLLLQQNGLTLEDIEIVDLPITSRQEALTNGAIDVAGAGEPWITRFSNAGTAVMWQPFNTLLPDFAFGAVGFGPNLLVDHPDVGQRFMVAFLKGLAKYNEGKTPRNLEILAQYTQLSTDEIDQACWQMMDPEGDFNIDSIIAFQDWAISKGYMETAVTAEQLFDPSFVEYARELVP